MKKIMSLIFKQMINHSAYRSIITVSLIITATQYQTMAFDHYDAVRAKTGEPIELVHPEWGFQDFDASTTYYVTTLTQHAIQENINTASANGGGTVIVAAGTVNITTNIDMKDNVKVKGTLVNGVRATTLNVTAEGYVAVFRCRGGENMTIENFIIDVNNYSVHGINFYNDKVNNFLICNNEIHSTPSGSNASGFNLFFERENDFFNSNITIKHNYIYNIGMHCIGLRSATKVLLYSNVLVNSGGYGIDISAKCLQVEAAGNHIHDGDYGIKAYSGNYIYMHHNDINNAGTDAIALWVDPSWVSEIDGEVGAPMYLWIEHNNISNNSGRAIAVWRTDYPNIKHLILRNNDVTNSTSGDYNIYLANAELVDVYGDHGKISAENSTIVYHDETTYKLTVSSGTGSDDYKEDDVVNIAPDAPPTGKTFDQWTGDTQYLNSSVTTASNSVTMPADDIAVAATFKTSTSTVNLALNKTVLDSSGGESVNPAIEAIDGSTSSTSRWSTPGLQTSPQWMEIDLGALYSISSTELICLNDRAYQFTVDVKSTSDGSYTQVVDRSSNTTPGTVTNPITDYFSAINAHYVKITITGAAVYTGDWCSLIEFRIFGFLKSAEVPADMSLANNGIAVYPNPAKSTLTILTNSKFENKPQVEIYNQTGDKVFSSSKDITFPYQIDISSFKTGVYLICVLNGDKLETVKIIKQ